MSDEIDKKLDYLLIMAANDLLVDEVRKDIIDKIKKICELYYSHLR